MAKTSVSHAFVCLTFLVPIFCRIHNTYVKLCQNHLRQRHTYVKWPQNSSSSSNCFRGLRWDWNTYLNIFWMVMIWEKLKQYDNKMAGLRNVIFWSYILAHFDNLFIFFSKYNQLDCSKFQDGFSGRSCLLFPVSLAYLWDSKWTGNICFLPDLLSGRQTGKHQHHCHCNDNAADAQDVISLWTSTLPNEDSSCHDIDSVIIAKVISSKPRDYHLKSVWFRFKRIIKHPEGWKA